MKLFGHSMLNFSLHLRVIRSNGIYMGGGGVGGLTVKYFAYVIIIVLNHTLIGFTFLLLPSSHTHSASLLAVVAVADPVHVPGL